MTMMDVFSIGLGLNEDDLRMRLLEPELVVLFRGFKYAPKTSNEEGFGIGEHTG
jgi:isopenicillin N synthase-like dioxygenase